MSYILNGSYDEESYNKLLEEIYKGIEKAHPDIDSETKEEYARIALYMIKKNKTEMAIHAPRKSTDRWYRLLDALKESKKQELSNEEKIISIEDLRKTRK